MRAKTINELQNFERGVDPQKSLKIGRDRFKKDGDQELGDVFIRDHPEEPRIILVNKHTGEEMEIGLYAAYEAIDALKFSLRR
jgi:hypothetical protein